MKPITRLENFLAKIAQDPDAKEISPKTRREYYLAAMAGDEVDLPDPLTRKDYYLKEIAENGGGVKPEGTISITANDTYDVTNYASAEVNVPQPSGTIEITSQGQTSVKDYAFADVDIYQLQTVAIISNFSQITDEEVANVFSSEAEEGIVTYVSGTMAGQAAEFILYGMRADFSLGAIEHYVDIFLSGVEYNSMAESETDAKTCITVDLHFSQIIDQATHEPTFNADARIMLLQSGVWSDVTQYTTLGAVVIKSYKRPTF